jgi:YqjK-like protein
MAAPVSTAQYRALLALRREHLVQRAQQQRVQLAHSLEPALRATRWLDRGAALWRTARGRPGLALAGALVPAVALAVWKPRGLLRALSVALALWRIKNAWVAARAPGASSR